MRSGNGPAAADGPPAAQAEPGLAGGRLVCCLGQVWTPTMDPVRKQAHCRNFLQCKQELAPNAEAGMPALPLRKFTARRHATTSRAAPRTTRERRALPRLQVHRPIFPQTPGLLQRCVRGRGACPQPRPSLPDSAADRIRVRQGGRPLRCGSCLSARGWRSSLICAPRARASAGSRLGRVEGALRLHGARCSAWRAVQRGCWGVEGRTFWLATGGRTARQLARPAPAAQPTQCLC